MLALVQTPDMCSQGSRKQTKQQALAFALRIARLMLEDVSKNIQCSVLAIMKDCSEFARVAIISSRANSRLHDVVMTCRKNMTDRLYR